jgi:hypothetical protein
MFGGVAPLAQFMEQENGVVFGIFHYQDAERIGHGTSRKDRF